DRAKLLRRRRHCRHSALDKVTVHTAQRITVMITKLADIDPKRVAAILYRRNRTLVSCSPTYPRSLMRQGVHVGGFVQQT
ncbi:hypothetical protein AAFX91_42035, partial [Bradyrhizobium sp. 31Argb]|uniref:hypothetical protein n=1 Tax=Bradyrhizobium sp. 31Argb TaxID=3141247 RepID=UPI003747D9A8